MDNAAALSPKLAPPGAGIPTLERLIGGAIFRLNRWRGTRERFAAQFQHEREAIGRLYRGIDARILEQRVLIPRLRGLEDSSRFWSVCMTLDHLRIVNEQITQVIAALTHGRIPENPASTAAVKPSLDVGTDASIVYENSCDRFTTFTSSCRDLRTQVSYAHPWFGPLDGAGWHAMAGMHMAIHRAQIARILAVAPGRRA